MTLEEQYKQETMARNMAKSRRPCIRFNVDDFFKTEAEKYAKVKGFENASSLARVALYYYMRKNPLGSTGKAKKPCSGTAEETGNGSNDNP